MKPYLLSLGVGLLVGVIYSALSVRSPAPPLIALVGLLGILIGEQALPYAKRLIQAPLAETVVRPHNEQQGTRVGVKPSPRPGNPADDNAGERRP